MLRENYRFINLGRLLLVVLITASCSGGGRVSSNKIRAIEAKLDQAYEYWKGTPYQLGGDNKQGIDCSALLMIIMKDQFGIKIPRSTREQFAEGRRVSAKNLLPGDFIFFKTGANTLHVGVLIRPGKFLHASTSNGVIISEMSNPYWRDRIIGFRRFL